VDFTTNCSGLRQLRTIFYGVQKIFSYLTALVYDDSWVRVLKTKKRLFEIVQDCNNQQSEGFSWDLDVHSMPFDTLWYQYLWNDALYLMWNESLNYTITSRKPLPSDQQIDQCAACKVINEDEEQDLILCDGCPKMYHLECASM
jgi:hypothetical protein